MIKRFRKFVVLLLLPLLVASFLSVGYLQTVSASELFSDGFESGDLSAWTGSNESPEVVTDIKYSGNYSAKFNVTGEKVYKTGLTTATAWSCWVYFTENETINWFNTAYDNLPDAHTWYVFTDDNTPNVWGIGLYPPTDEVYSNQTTINENTWYHIAVKTVTGTGNGTMTLYVNGVEVCSEDDLTMTAFGYSIEFGVMAPSTYTVYIDDVKIGTTYEDVQYDDPEPTPTPTPTATPTATPTPSPAPSVTPIVNGDLTDTEWFVSALMLVLVVVNIVLIAVPFALVRFVFGALAFSLSALAFTLDQIPLSPYLQIMSMVVSVVCMFLAARARE